MGASVLGSPRSSVRWVTKRWPQRFAAVEWERKRNRANQGWEPNWKRIEAAREKGTENDRWRHNKQVGGGAHAGGYTSDRMAKGACIFWEAVRRGPLSCLVAAARRAGRMAEARASRRALGARFS